MRRIRLPLALWALLCSAISYVPAGAQSAPDPLLTPQERQSYLAPPSKALIERDLQPLSAKLPDTSLRAGIRPADVSREVFDPRETPSPLFRGEDWTPFEYNWVAAELQHRPLYFEDAMLERHGQMRRPLVQPLASGARFFLTFPVLPYAMTVNPPRPAHSTLGHFRPGSTAPLLLQRPPLQADAGLVEAGTWIGLIFLIP